MEFAGLTARATSFIRHLQLYPHLFDQFKRVMKDYSTDKLNVGAVVSELEIFFQYHPYFLTEYRIFLSLELGATLPPPHRSPNTKRVIEPDLEILRACIDYMNKVQKRFADEHGVIVEYLDTIRKLTQGELCNEEAYNAILKIFASENQDLVDEFEFLIDGKESKMKKKVEKKKNSSLPSNSGDEIKARNRMEDEMFELDINLSHQKITVYSANKLMDSLEEEQHQIINIDKYFSAVSLGYIMKVYKEEGSSIITRLREEDPRRVLPEILEKLESEERS